MENHWVYREGHELPNYDVVITVAAKQDGTPYICLTGMFLDDDCKSYEPTPVDYYLITDKTVERVKNDCYGIAVQKKVSEIINPFLL